MATKSNHVTREEAEQIANEIEYKKQADAAFIDGIIGLFIFHLILGIIAVVRAGIAMRSEDPAVISRAKTGKILGMIDIIYPLAGLFLVLMISTIIAAGY